jgi:hypothetical protein
MIDFRTMAAFRDELEKQGFVEVYPAISGLRNAFKYTRRGRNIARTSKKTYNALNRGLNHPAVVNTLADMNSSAGTVSPNFAVNTGAGAVLEKTLEKGFNTVGNMSKTEAKIWAGRLAFPVKHWPSAGSI